MKTPYTVQLRELAAGDVFRYRGKLWRIEREQDDYGLRKSGGASDWVLATKGGREPRGPMRKVTLIPAGSEVQTDVRVYVEPGTEPSLADRALTKLGRKPAAVGTAPASTKPVSLPETPDDDYMSQLSRWARGSE